MAIKTHKEYRKNKKDEPTLEKKERKVQETGREGTPSPVFFQEGPEKVIPKTFILQDPESRTFKDSIIIDGKNVEREVDRGRLETREEILKTFLVNKGWILLDILERPNWRQ